MLASPVDNKGGHVRFCRHPVRIITKQCGHRVVQIDYFHLTTIPHFLIPETVTGNARASHRLTSAPPGAFVGSTSQTYKQTTPSTPEPFSPSTHHNGGPQRARQVCQVHRAYHPSTLRLSVRSARSQSTAASSVEPTTCMCFNLAPMDHTHVTDLNRSKSHRHHCNATAKNLQLQALCARCPKILKQDSGTSVGCDTCSAIIYCSSKSKERNA